eukprot:Amastigsp_a508731_21.p3 type:complete len:193 gc:universal Amastigsp_a508731_21:1001-423(-)
MCCSQRGRRHRCLGWQRLLHCAMGPGLGHQDCAARVPRAPRGGRPHGPRVRGRVRRRRPAHGLCWSGLTHPPLGPADKLHCRHIYRASRGGPRPCVPPRHARALLGRRRPRAQALAHRRPRVHRVAVRSRGRNPRARRFDPRSRGLRFRRHLGPCVQDHRAEEPAVQDRRPGALSSRVRRAHQRGPVCCRCA